MNVATATRARRQRADIIAKLSPRAIDVLLWMDWSSGPLWWHDLPHPTRVILHQRGLIRDDGRRMRCGTPDHSHPGYVCLTAKGERVAEDLRAEDIRTVTTRSRT